MKLSTSYIVHPEPDLAYGGGDGAQLLDAFGQIPSSVVFTQGADNKTHVFYFPSFFNKLPLLPGVEFVIENDGSVLFKGVLEDVTLGVARDWQELGTAKAEAFVVIDHGLETAGGYETWPHGHVWLAQDDGAGFVFQQISSDVAFNHSLAIGDLNGDGRDDAVSMNMGGFDNQAGIVAYLQKADGTFEEDLFFFGQHRSPGFPGAISLADLNGDGAVELIIARYNSSPEYPFNNPYSVKVISMPVDGKQAQVVESFPNNAGNFANMGAANVETFDFDRDGDLDIIARLEDFSANIGLEIFSNDGDAGLTRVTASLLTKSRFGPTEFNSGIEIADFDQDGWDDIILPGWGNGFMDWQGRSMAVGNMLLRNLEGTGFESLGSYDGADLALQQGHGVDFVRYGGLRNDAATFLGFTGTGAPLTVAVQFDYRDASETLVVTKGMHVRGFGGNDVFNVLSLGGAVFGDEGFDEVRLSQPRSSYQLTGSASSLAIELGGETMSVTGVEKLVFAGSAYNLEIASKAGMVGSETLGSLVDLYVAYFNRVPEASGLGYWIDQYLAGKSLATIAAEFYAAGIQFSEVTGYTADMPLSDFIKVLYANVLGRSGSSAPPQADVDYWLDQVGTGAVTREGMVARFLNDARQFYDHPEVGWVPRLLDQKVEFGKLHAVTYGLDYNDNATSIETTVALAAAVTPEGHSTAVAMVGLSADDYLA